MYIIYFVKNGVSSLQMKIPISSLIRFLTLSQPKLANKILWSASSYCTLAMVEQLCFVESVAYPSGSHYVAPNSAGVSKIRFNQSMINQQQRFLGYEISDKFQNANITCHFSRDSFNMLLVDIHCPRGGS